MGWVLFFDGECAFCSESVRWIARLDKRGRISFAPLQGKLGARMGLEKHADGENGTMVLLRESDGKMFYFSDSVIELARALGGGWRILTIARWIPRRLRNGVYRWIARNRHRLVRRSDTCGMPDPAVQDRLRE